MADHLDAVPGHFGDHLYHAEAEGNRKLGYGEFPLQRILYFVQFARNSAEF
jgi:hypothetical protein